MIDPHDDDDIVVNKIRKRYMLTEKAFIDFVYDIRNQIIDGGLTTP